MESEMAVANTALQERIDEAGTTLDRGDADGMAALYTEDGQLLPPGSDVVTGRDSISAFWRGVFESGVESVELSPVEIEDHGSTAIEVGRFRLGDATGQLIDEGKYVVVWKQEDGEWRLHRDIWNSNGSTEQ
jgi:uncharacterized protein (TIGR02246 family)